ncbi:MAG TPA: hypothetical protein VLE47_03255 [Candidatus Saccharimonadales bacterium]|nr:hypothetical protein [Candidatus Saccharimonadales bacterium]
MKFTFLLKLQKALLLIPAFGFILLLAFSASSLVKSESTKQSGVGSTFSDLQQQLNSNLKKQSDLQKKISDSQNQEKNLASQMAFAEDQIELTQLKIDETQNRIAQLAIDVSNTQNQVSQTSDDLNNHTDITNQRIRSVYESGKVQTFELMLQTNGINDFLLLKKYSEAIHDQDVKMITDLKELKETLQEEKNKLSDQKTQAETLNAQLNQQVTDLGNQKRQQGLLLEATKNNEANYQKLLAQSKLDQQIIQNALFNLGTKLGPVKRGEIIAFQGNTGCSTGTHLHFGYLVRGTPVNPVPYINNGTLGKPEDSYQITQAFGANAIPGLYGPGGHPAIDIQGQPYPGWNTPIHAAHDGTAYLGSDSGCPNVLPGTGKGKGITIDHGDGTKTIYWHIR